MEGNIKTRRLKKIYEIIHIRIILKPGYYEIIKYKSFHIGKCLKFAYLLSIILNNKKKSMDFRKINYEIII